MSLKEYKAKRDFSKTSEPAGARGAKAKDAGPFFVVQKHAARRLHYDFRLEMEGVLKSWAVPKGFPTTKGEKRLAVHVEDHPIDYADFEGIIAQGNYGAGTVMVWDRGIYHVFGDDPVGALKNGKIHFELFGEKLKGEWTLVRMRGSASAGGNEWLLLKTGADAKPISVRRDDQSVLTNRSMKKISTDADAEWQSNRVARPAAVRKAAKVGFRPQSDSRKSRAPDTDNKASGSRGKKGKTLDRPQPNERNRSDFVEVLEQLPPANAEFIDPMKCLLARHLPKGSDWIYEIKFDGYRALAIKKGAKVSLISRNQKDLSHRYAPIADDLRKLRCEEAVVDGEIVALDENGRPSFQLLQCFESAGRQCPPLVYYAFDLLQLDGRDLRGLPLEQRKRGLESIVAGVSDCIRFSAGLDAEINALADEMQARGLEGLIAKKRGSKYESGRRSGAWTKFKWACEQEFVIGGYTPPEGSRTHFGAVLVGYYEGNRLLFASKVGTGFNDELLRSLYARFQELRRADPPFANLPEKRPGRGGQGLTASEMRRCTWVEPELVCQVRFTEWTRDNHLRQPVFLGLREDKEAREVRKEGE